MQERPDQNQRANVKTNVNMTTGKDDIGIYSEHVTTNRIYINAQNIAHLISANERQIKSVNADIAKLTDDIAKLNDLLATLEAQKTRYQEIKTEFDLTGKITGQVETPTAGGNA